MTLGEAAASESTTTEARRAALEAIAAEVRVCRNCRLAETRTRAVPGEGHPDTEVMFVGEGPGQTEDQQGRPFVGRAGDLLVKLLVDARLAPPGGVHHERREVPAAGQPRPRARRDRRVRAVPPAPARLGMSSSAIPIQSLPQTRTPCSSPSCSTLSARTSPASPNRPWP